MTQITQTKLKDLNVLQLYEHYNVLEKSLPLLTPDSQQLAKSELESCANLRSEKIDRIYYAMASHEAAIERAKQEGELIAQAKKHHESQLKSLKGLLNWLRRALPSDTNKITGRNYQFVLSKKKDLTITITSQPEEWSSEEQNKFCIQEETTITKQVVVRCMAGNVLSNKTEPKTTTKIVPNLDTIRNAYQNGEQLPPGIKIVQEYSIRSKRIFAEPKVELQASEYFGDVLPEAGAAD